MTSYTSLLESKIKLAEDSGFAVSPAVLHPSSLPHQVDTIIWALKKGRALIGSSFGLGKTHTQIELLRLVQQQVGGQVLIVCPLGVKHQFTEEDGPRLGVQIRYVRNDAEAAAAGTDFLITNYERVRDGHFSEDFLAGLSGVSLDEGSVLRSLGTKTTQTFMRLLKPVRFRFICTATPSPNNYVELVHYADFLGVMDAGQILSRWFKRDSTKAHNSQLHPQHEDEFWLWVSSWALFLTRPSDLGYSDTGYDLPELKIVWHRVATPPAEDAADKSGQYLAITSAAASLPEASREKKRTVEARLQAALALLGTDTSRHWLLWHHLEDERRAIEKALPEARTVYGAQDLDAREELILGFSRGEYRILATKPEIAGSGCNFQRYCSANIFLGINYDFEDMIQAVHRTHRFQQPNQVEVHILYTEAEEPIRKAIEEKWKRHTVLMEKMRGIIQRYGLAHAEALRSLNRKMGVARQQAEGKSFVSVNHDCVIETATMASDSVHLIHTSIPFSNQFEYSANYADFGHNEDDAAFFAQMDYLVPELLRVLQPGRVAAIHVKDAIAYGNVTGLGMTSVVPFSDHTVQAFIKHGFIYCGRRTVVTDVVRENNQTYRLSYSEMCKDSSKMGCGMNEYVLLFRKRPSGGENAYADVPVARAKEDYSLARWQLDASGFWRSDGNSLLTPRQVANMDPSDLIKWYHASERGSVYNYEGHVRLCEQLLAANRLPKTFALLPPVSHDAGVWSDVTYVKTLNTRQTQKGAQNHVCPLPIDIVDRTINLYTMLGEVVYDPFAGIGTVPYRAIVLGRQGRGCELNPHYWAAQVAYCREAEYKAAVPTLFDMPRFAAA